MAKSGTNIKMDPTEMEKRAKEFDSSCTEFGKVVKKMEKEVKTLEAEWEGASSRAFAQQFTQLKPSFTKTSQLITDIATQLRAISKAIKSTDDDISKKIGVK